MSPEWSVQVSLLALAGHGNSARTFWPGAGGLVISKSIVPRALPVNPAPRAFTRRNTLTWPLHGHSASECVNSTSRSAPPSSLGVQRGARVKLP